jgi:hypothetical protein
MQDTKVTKDSATSSGSLAFIILAILNLVNYYVCTYKLEHA